ncbi:MAG: hypothetical protein ABWY78_08100 [Microvirga sp.]
MSERSKELPVAALNGRWRTRRYEDMGEYVIAINPNGVDVVAKNNDEDGRCTVSNIRYEKYKISFSTHFSMTGRRTRVAFQYDPTSRTVIKHLAFGDACLPYRVDLHPYSDRISGTWRNDEDEMRAKYTVTEISGQQTVRAHDFIDGEQYEVSDVRHHETVISFRTYMRSMSRRVHVSLTYVPAIDVIAMAYTWSESCMACKADSDTSLSPERDSSE